MPLTDSIVDLMREAQQRLRHEGFLHEKACYAALLLPHDSATAFALVCGDCCVGYCPQGGQTEWLTRSHTLANACGELGIEATASWHQIVTRTLNAKRFERPEVTECNGIDPGVWILATDGFRAGQTLPDIHSQDDCSCLRVGAGLPTLSESDCDNMLVRTMDPAVPARFAEGLA
ncbi:hypothetical protein [Paraburkholderia sp. PGU19]|uniref:hypothetical protein n=1 Tax=Paraburkholderia sp. PGU19 TaxID=2735434 RepID=UPI0015DBB00D|nr:hypothetical protein [Paraburkholderia sp. PGU19]